MPDSLSLMAIFSHPDDEAFGVAGTLAKYAVEGVETSLVTATDGEAGEIVDPALATPNNLGEVRRRELQCSADVMGVKHVRRLGFPDGHLAEVDRDQAVGAIVAVIRELRPLVVVTFDPNGVYGHSDHVATYELTVAAVEAAADSTRFAGPPHRVAKLYFRAMPITQAKMMEERMAQIRRGLGLPPAGVDVLATPEEQVTTVIDVRQFADVKARAIMCHRTQIRASDMNGWAADARTELLSWEYYSLRDRRRQPGEPLEPDLFTGLR